ncbi:deaminase domain-containing protein [Pseudomonas sp. JAI120]|uniref:deaminase domain-containing protein n=1 Tax=Pseudomonas sp. JAI120 TaxID=2723063 RepID=UPI00403F6779
MAEGERLVYLSNSTAPRIRGRLSAAVSDVRTGLPREGNVAFAEVDVGALSSETMVMKAYSQFDNRVEEFLPKPGGDLNSWILKPQVSTSKYVGTTEGYLRDMDTEFKILETLAQRLGPSSQTSGRINLISEKMVCPSCTSIVNQFRERYPNIQLNIFTVEK